MARRVVHSIAELLSMSTHALSDACAAGQKAYAIVPSHAWAQQRKLQLRHVLPVGVEVLTQRDLITEMWDVFGDGTRLIDPAARKVLLRPLITQVGLLEGHPSVGLVEQLSAFVEEAVAPALTPSSDLSDSEAKIMELVSLYEHKLEIEGLTEVAQAECAIVQMGVRPDTCFVYEAPDLHSARIRRFITDIEAAVPVTVLDRGISSERSLGVVANELEELRQRLFTGVGGVHARGSVRAGSAHGAHVTHQLSAALVQKIHEQDHIDYQDMVVGYGSLSDAFPQLYETYARMCIPFNAHFSLPCARTGLGAAFYECELVCSEFDDDIAFESLVDIACGPYSGIPQRDARALQAHWRERAHSTLEERMRDVHEGFAQGNATPAMIKERLAPLVAVIDSSRKERIELMFRHAQQMGLDVDTLIDDRAAAETLLDYLEICERYSCEPDVEEMANLPVALERGFGDCTHALTFIESGQLGLAKAKAVVLADLDADHYPMAAQAGPFDALMAKLGIARADNLALLQRIMLLDSIEASEESFAFACATHNDAGDEICQSALFDELVAAYRTDADEAEGLPLQAIPRALRSFHTQLSEAGVFAREQALVPAAFFVTRGSINNAEHIKDLIQNLHGGHLLFSPTALEDYYRCPYRWFTSRRVSVRSMDSQFDQAAQGNLVHAAMERFYKELFEAGFERVTRQNLSRALEIASSAFDHQVEYDTNRSRSGLYLKTQQDIRMCESLRGCVFDLVERDADFLPGFKPAYFELSPGHQTDQVLEYAGVPVRGKADRVDIDDAGNAVVIDYKLSKLAQGYGFAAKEITPKRIQTDIYAVLVERHFAALGMPVTVVGSVYRSYSTNNMRGVYARSVAWGDTECRKPKLDALPHEGSSETYGEYLQRIENTVSECVQGIREGAISPNPRSADACEYCKALSFCPKRSA